MALVISPKVRPKLAERHNVTELESEECFANRTSAYLEDTREDHKTEPLTQWFIAETDNGRKLKVVFILEENDITIRTAYEPNAIEQQIYDTHSK